MHQQRNAGLRLWDIQKFQGTGLCVGLDPHYDPSTELNHEFYCGVENQYTPEMRAIMRRQIEAANPGGRFLDELSICNLEEVVQFAAGLASYFLRVIDIAWKAGIRVYKPQASFYESLAPYGMLILEILCKHIRGFATIQPSTNAFIILDAKRGDIETTQAAYYKPYLSTPHQEVTPGIHGRYDFDAMTVTTWMGQDVLTPGLQFFKEGKGAIVVTRTSNPSGTTFQDLWCEFNPQAQLSDNQKSYQVMMRLSREVNNILGMPASVHHIMLYMTSLFSCSSDLDSQGISPVFSVMGSTVKMDNSFRILRPGGIALVPGFGAQGGKFENIMPLLVKNGPLAGHLGILSSSRDHNFPWTRKAGGKGDPNALDSEMDRAISSFRKEEKAAYIAAGAKYPY